MMNLQRICEIDVPGTAHRFEALMERSRVPWEISMPKPKSRPQRQYVEHEPANDDEARLETFERGTQPRNDDALARSDTPDSLAPANELLDAND